MIPPRRAIARTDEFLRIATLPRRRWSEDDPETIDLAARMSVLLRLPGSTAELWPVQAIALADLYECGGLFAPIPVGGGKTLVTFLAPVAYGMKRPILLVPHKLVEKTIRDFRRLALDWRSPESFYIESYEMLSRDYADGDDEVSLLDQYGPDGLLCDEVHWLKNPRAARTKKFNRFRARHPEIPFAGLSGTTGNRSLGESVHIQTWALGAGAPAPKGGYAIKEWCSALDVGIERRIHPGALLDFATDEDYVDAPDELTVARRGYRRRFVETPGIVAYAKPYDLASLSVTEVGPPAYGPATETAFAKLRDDWELPDGTTLEDGKIAVSRDAPGLALENGMAVAAAARSLALGFYDTWDPPPPPTWMAARKAWHKACRVVLSTNRRGLDSAEHVARAALRDELRDGWPRARATLERWRAVRPSYRPKTKAVWIDDAAIRFVESWMVVATKRGEPGIVWVDRIAFAERLAKITGALFYHRAGFAGKAFIDDSRPGGRRAGAAGCIIASVEANAEGRNLQEHWSNNFVVSPPSTGQKWNQLLGRTHRHGQPADEVSCDALIGCREHVTAWLSAMADGYFTVDTSGLPSKLLYCDATMPDDAELDRRTGTTARYPLPG